MQQDGYQLPHSDVPDQNNNQLMQLRRQHTCRQLLAGLWVVGMLLGACTAQEIQPSQRQAAADAESVPTITKAAASTGSRRVGQPLWLQERAKTHPNSDARQEDTQTSSAASTAQRMISTASYILLQRDQALAQDKQNRVKHVLKVSSPAAGSRAAVPAIRVTSRGLRGGVVHRASLKSQGEAANITIRIPEGNEYLGVGVFADDMDAGANVDIALALDGELITESNNPAGVDDFLEAPEGLMPGEYTLMVKVSMQLYCLPTALPLRCTASHLYRLTAAGCY